MSFGKIYLIGYKGVMGKLLHARIDKFMPEMPIITFDKDDVLEFSNGTAKKPNLILISTPVLTIPRILAQIFDLNPKHTYINEIGSVKSQIPLMWFCKHSPVKDSLFFDSVHPMVGPAASDWDVLDWKKNCLFVTNEKTDLKGANKPTEKFWQELGFVTRWVSLIDHDRVIGTLSHLSHFMIMEYVNFVKKTLKPEEIELGGTSFAMFSKLAEGATRLSDIYQANDELWDIVKDFSKALTKSNNIKKRYE